jgi:hypothetical protein
MSDQRLRLVPVSSGRLELISLAHTTNHMGNSCSRLDGSVECTVCDLVAELSAARGRIERLRAALNKLRDEADEGGLSTGWVNEVVEEALAADDAEAES